MVSGDHGERTACEIIAKKKKKIQEKGEKMEKKKSQFLGFVLQHGNKFAAHRDF